MCIFVHENKNHASLPQLPEYKNKKKWQEIVREAKLSAQKNVDGSLLTMPCAIKGCHSLRTQKYY
jgi:hypothetical protein